MLTCKSGACRLYGLVMRAERQIMFAIGNDELKKLPNAGDMAKCPGCGKAHVIKYGDKIEKDGTKTPSKLLGFVKCGEDSYMVSINGKLLA